MSGLSIAAAVVGLIVGVFAATYLAYRYGSRVEALFDRWWTAPFVMPITLALFVFPPALAVAFGEIAGRFL
jgi:ABC-type spermidine/putrescine transport system permease subunit II